MNPLESFCFYTKSLWSGDVAKRLPIQIVDTIIFLKGRPYSWLFTSQKTGVSLPYNVTK